MSYQRLPSPRKKRYEDYGSPLKLAFNERQHIRQAINGPVGGLRIGFLERIQTRRLRDITKRCSGEGDEHTLCGSLHNAHRIRLRALSAIRSEPTKAHIGSTVSLGGIDRCIFREQRGISQHQTGLVSTATAIAVEHFGDDTVLDVYAVVL